MLDGLHSHPLHFAIATIVFYQKLLTHVALQRNHVFPPTIFKTVVIRG